GVFLGGVQRRRVLPPALRGKQRRGVPAARCRGRVRPCARPLRRAPARAGHDRDYLNEAARADFGGDPWLPTLATGSGSGRVAILSFHAAKGREWDTVVVAGCLDAWIPKGRRAQGLFDPLALEIAEAADREV